jgi:hypothetical protein
MTRILIIRKQKWLKAFKSNWTSRWGHDVAKWCAKWCGTYYLLVIKNTCEVIEYLFIIYNITFIRYIYSNIFLHLFILSYQLLTHMII